MSSSPFGIAEEGARPKPSEEEEDPTRIPIVYTRRSRPVPSHEVPPSCDFPRISQCGRNSRVSFAPARRSSWIRSLNTRGRRSIVVTPGVDLVPNPKQKETKKKPPRPPGKKRFGKQEYPDFRKEISYFQEVDAVELLEESPSPKQFSTWEMDATNCYIHDLSAILERWKISKFANSYRRSGVLFDILETPVLESTSSEVSESGKVPQFNAAKGTCQRSITSKLEGEVSADTARKDILGSFGDLRLTDETFGHAEVLSREVDGKDNDRAAIRKGSLESRSLSLKGEHKDAFMQLLDICRQSEPLSLTEAFSQICDPSAIVKIGEGTYGEAFKAGDNICKIVPIDGDLLVNGEVQKRSEEVLEEVLLSLTLNSLREQDGNSCTLNSCSGFIETRGCRICRGAYDAALINAWESWDSKHGSENDNPREFSEKQCYIVFVLADGGKDLESFVLSDYDEARSFLIQVAASLAVAEVSCQFEHRDLHWGNILLSRREVQYLDFYIQGRKMHIATKGIVVSIIDFTLSRINTDLRQVGGLLLSENLMRSELQYYKCVYQGEAILFLDLSMDPELFEGPKGDKQSETYRKMKEVTEDCWEGSFPKTNVLWLQYLVDILLLKKSFKRTKNDERDLRSFRKHLNMYGSAKDSLADGFFADLYEVTSEVVRGETSPDR